MPQQIRFASFVLDTENERLTKDQQLIALRPKALLLLDYLARRSGELATKEALLDALWPGVHVTDAVLKVAIGELRRSLGDSPRSPELIETVHRRGYRFIAATQFVEADPTPNLHSTVDADTPSSPSPAPAPTARQSTATAPQSKASDFVGREDALASLSHQWNRAQAGEFSIGLVSGAPGIGKTRIVEEFARSRVDESSCVLRARGTDREALPGFMLWAQIVEELSIQADFREAVMAFRETAEAGRLLPKLEEHAPANVSDLSNSHPTSSRTERPVPSSDKRFRLFEQFSHLLDTCAAHSPLVLILDDLQWSDTLSLRLLEHVASKLVRARILIVATLREAVPGVDRPVDRSAVLLRRLGVCTAVALPNFSLDETARLFQARTGRHASSRLAQLLFERTEGVPLFVSEAIRIHEDLGDFSDPEAAAQSLPLPSRSVDLLRRSIDGASPSTMRLLQAGAVLGREFSLTAAAAISEVPRSDALDHFDEAIHAGVLIDLATTVATYRFSHALYREWIYEELQPGERARLHHRAALRLEAQYSGATTPILSELAHHLHRGIAAGDPEHSFEVAREAGTYAVSQLAYEEAAAHYEQAHDALDHCDHVEATRRLDTLLAIGQAQRLAGDHRRRRAAFRRAVQTARQVGSADELAQAAIGLCNLAEWSPGDVEGGDAVRVALEAIEASDSKGEWLIERARLVARLAYLRAHESSAAADLAGQAVRLARESQDPEALQEALYADRFIATSDETASSPRTDIGELVDAARNSINRDAGALGVLHAAYGSLMRGDASESARLRQLAGELTGSAPTLRWYMTAWDTGMALMQGRFDEVESLAIEALSIGHRTRHPFAEPVFNGHMAQLARDRGDWDEVVRRLGPALEGRLGAFAWVRAMVGHAKIALGESDAARRLLEEMAKNDFEIVIQDRLWVGTLPVVAALAVELSDRARGESLRELLRDANCVHAVFAAVVNYGGPYRYAEARLDDLLGNSTDAIENYREAESAAKALGAEPMAARIDLDWAAALAAAGEEDSARERIASGSSRAKSMGMGALSSQFETLSGRLGSGYAS